MTTERIDVLAVMDKVAIALNADAMDHGACGSMFADELDEARAAVAELIEAGKALLAGSVAQATAADHADMPAEDKADAEFRASVARDAMRAALARVSGGA